MGRLAGISANRGLPLGGRMKDDGWRKNISREEGKNDRGRPPSRFGSKKRTVVTSID